MNVVIKKCRTNNKKCRTNEKQLYFMNCVTCRSSCSAYPLLQAMRFGDLPAWATEISTSVKETIQFTDYVSDPMTGADCHSDLETCSFPPNLLCREPFFDQLIVNIYQPGEVRCITFLEVVL